MGAELVTAPFRDPRPARGDLNVWPPHAEFDPETIAAYMVEARRLRIEAIGKHFEAVFAACWKFLRC
jgi:hypothetical protein